MIDAPLVSVIVRSMGRAELATALRSAAAQSHSLLDIVVVDATGGHHPALPDIALRPGHTLRMVGTGERLQRARACNVGLDAARGEYFSLLDDDDEMEPTATSTLLAAAQQNPQADLVYGRASIIAADGSVERTMGRPYNPVLMYYGPLAPPPTSLIHRRVLARGCRFDEAFEVCEDRDFLAQIAQASPFVFVPALVYRYHVTLGTSGTGPGANTDDGRASVFENLFRAKWAGPRGFHVERCTRFSRRAVYLYSAGDRLGARAQFERALVEYPQDPSAQSGLARIEIEDGQLDSARSRILNALQIDPASAEFRLTLAEVFARQGEGEKALIQARAASADPRFRGAADAMVARLRAQAPGVANARAATSSAPSAPSPSSTPAAAPIQEAVAAPIPAPTHSPAHPSPSRTAPCPCGSGLKFKTCHGSLQSATPVAAESKADREVRRAWADFIRGEATQALLRVDAQHAQELTSAAMARHAGDICDAMGACLRALAFYRRSIELVADPSVRLQLHHASTHAFQPIADASAYATIRALAAQAGEGRAARTTGRQHAGDATSVHFIGVFTRIGGAEQRALNLCRLLAPHVDVRLWSLHWPPHTAYADQFPIRHLRPDAQDAPAVGTLVFANHLVGWDERTDWLDRAKFSRFVICHNLDRPENLLQRVTQLVSLARPVTLDFTFPSQLVRTQSALPGPVEYNPIDTTHFMPSPRRPGAHGAMVIGRHSRDVFMKHHPDNPSLLRRAVARGHRFSIMGGTTLAAALAGDPALASIELLREGAVDVKSFLGSLDCYLYRTHPHFMETGGTSLFEAMSMELPVVLFRERCGAAELFVDGENGFLVDTEDEALAAIDRLAADPPLRAVIGRAARATIVEALRDQRERIVQFYRQGAQMAA